MNIKQFKLELNPDKIEVRVECYADLTRHIVDEYIFHKKFIVNRMIRRNQENIKGKFRLWLMLFRLRLKLD